MNAYRAILSLLALATFAFPLPAQETSPRALYEHLRAFALASDALQVENFTLKRDRVQMTFTGEFILASALDGQVYGAVFQGRGRLQTEPWSSFERENVRRLLKQETVEATFKSALLRFSDDTLRQLLMAGRSSSPASLARAQKRAATFEDRLVEETGLNLSARLASAVLNQDDPGVFFAEFDGGNRKRFALLLDHQCRAPASIFDINGGEKGLLYHYDTGDVWTAFYSEQDFQRGSVAYSDAFDLVAIPHYRFEIDLTDPGHWLRYKVSLDLVALRQGLQFVSMNLNEGLSSYRDARRKKGLRVFSAALPDGSPVGFIQHEWETGFSLVLPRPLAHEETLTVVLELEGKDTLWTWKSKFHYPRSTTTWYPRHGYLARSRFQFDFRHREKDRVVSVGQRLAEGPAEGEEKTWVTRWEARDPVALVTFAVGAFERHVEEAEVAGEKMPIEFYSVHGAYQQVKEDFVLAELINGVRYFSELYGNYPYGRLGAVYFPASYGQGFPSLLLLPVRGYARVHEFAFISHEVAHQWWGNIVGWRSYRDQWLSEGFAEYSGALYTGFREKDYKKELQLVKEMRSSLQNPPGTEVGIAKGKLWEVGPLILGHRLSSRRTRGAYTALIYNKGALVLRMLNFLLSDPSTGDDTAFFDMMKDFVNRHRNGWATTETFMDVASEHFARSPIARRYRLQDLKWFLHQWVYSSAMPRYRLEYKFEPQGDGAVLVVGTIYQEGVPDNWFMPVPLVFDFGGNRTARGTIPALGPSTPVQVRLPARPKKVKLDPDMWVLSAGAKVKKLK